MRARAPASSANLGPGFDVLAARPALYVEVEIVPADRLLARQRGRGGGSRLRRAAPGGRGWPRRSAATTASPSGPLRDPARARARLVGGARGRGRGRGRGGRPFRVARRLRGPVENAAASVRGGLVSPPCSTPARCVRRFPLDPGLGFVVLVPDRELLTVEARRALRCEVPHARRRLQPLPHGPAPGRPRRSQPARSAPPATTGFTSPSGRACSPRRPSCWRGSRRPGRSCRAGPEPGPSLLGICDGPQAAAQVRDAGEAALESLGGPRAGGGARARPRGPRRRGPEPGALDGSGPVRVDASAHGGLGHCCQDRSAPRSTSRAQRPLQVDGAVEHDPRRADGDARRLDHAHRHAGHLPGHPPRPPAAGQQLLPAVDDPRASSS